MGPPIFVAIADIVMRDIERRIFETSTFDIELWKRYAEEC